MKSEVRIEKGFTLVEILVAIAILGIFSVAISQVFFNIIRTESKTQAIQSVKQSGDYAYSVLEGGIRNAKEVTLPVCPTGAPVDSQTVTVVNPDDTSTIYACNNPTGKITATTDSNPLVHLIDQNTIISSCFFRVVCPVATSGDIKKYVYFTYTAQPTSAPSGDVNQSATETYQGTITIRN